MFRIKCKLGKLIRMNRNCNKIQFLNIFPLYYSKINCTNIYIFKIKIFRNNINIYVYNYNYLI